MEKASKNLKGIRIGVTGPESSGKTTLAKRICQLYKGKFIPEYAREYLNSIGRAYEQRDLPIIAQEQFNLNQGEYSSNLIVCDTEMTVMRIWYRFKYQSSSALIENLFERQTMDHLFLCSPDIPWEADPLREHPFQRDLLFEYYKNVLKEQPIPFTVVSGTLEQRCIQIEKVINKLIH
jgi:nicotinamide riboside kinase